LEFLLLNICGYLWIAPLEGSPMSECLNVQLGPGTSRTRAAFSVQKEPLPPRRWRLAVAVAVADADADADADAGTVRHWRESCNAENLSFASSLSQSVGGWFMHVVAFRAFAKWVRLRQVQSIESINQSCILLYLPIYLQ
jgi:hypothetical protein